MRNHPLIIRCSSLGRLMTEARDVDPLYLTPEIAAIKKKTKRTDEEKAALDEVLSMSLSAGAKTLVRELAAQDLLGIDFEISSKPIEKGLQVEEDGIALLNRVRGLALTKNTERRTDGFISGECDLFNAARRRGHDLKCPWSAATFPIAEIDCADTGYEWQMRGYMKLWDADEWDVDYALVDTPESLIGFEPVSLHVFGHIPERLRLTTWTVRRDKTLEARIEEKVVQARAYYARVVAEFERSHRAEGEPPVPPVLRIVKPAPQPAAPVAELAAPVF